MSYFDDASLVMIPSGYKTSKVYSVKPTDGTGDLAFTRSNDTATRVASNGLIEKVRTNLATYSNDFSNAAWSKSNTSVTAGQSDPFGGTSAFRLLNTSAGGFVLQSGITITGSLMTASVWVKSNTASTQTMLITANSGSEQSPAISVTTSWQRVSWSFTSSGNTNIVFAYNASTALDIIAYGFQLETGDIATDYIATTTAAVSVGPVANVPRLDYLGSTCPRLLLEPQRTNLLQYSEQFNNAYWEKGSVATITANSVISPDGTQNADTLTANGTGQLYVRYNVYLGTAQTCSSSIFAKKANHRYVGLRNSGTVSAHDVFDFDTKTWTNNSGATLSYDELGNGWFRLKSTNTDAVNLNYYWSVIPAVNTSGSENTTASNLSVYIWGAQAEQNAAYATSYIPTLGASVTRGADACSKTGISSLIGQTEGTLFAEFDFDSATFPKMIMFVTTASSFGNAIYIQTFSASGISFQVWNGVVNQVSINVGGFTNGQRIKVAIGYKANDFVIYVNGVQKGTDTSGTLPAALNNVEIGTYLEGGSPFSYANAINQALLFKTRLSNADLAALTA